MNSHEQAVGLFGNICRLRLQRLLSAGLLSIIPFADWGSNFFRGVTAIYSDNLQSQLPSLAASRYLNSAPLIWSFLRGSNRNHVQLIEAVPARCAQLLATGAVAAALVPVIEYQRMPNEVYAESAVCVGSKREVRSVVLVSGRDDLKEIRSIALDESSRTSATLIKVLFREFIGHEPEWQTFSPDLPRMLSAHDAALIIGDPAMTFDRAGLNVWDLASLWNQFTGLGFVFAMWMVRAEVLKALDEINFAAACVEGLANLDQISNEYSAILGLPAEELKLYLEENISFRIDDEMLRGLDLYFQLAQRHHLIDTVKALKTLPA